MYQTFKVFCYSIKATLLYIIIVVLFYIILLN